MPVVAERTVGAPPDTSVLPRASESLLKHPEKGHRAEVRLWTTPWVEAIGRPDLKDKLTPQTPWIDISIEIGDQDPGNPLAEGSKAGGGLGILEGCTRRQMIESGIPGVFMAPFYSREWNQLIVKHEAKNNGYMERGANGQERWKYRFQQVEDFREVKPEDYGFERAFTVDIPTYDNITPVGVYLRPVGSVLDVRFYEPGIDWLYRERPDGPHRAYLMKVLARAGVETAAKLGFYDFAKQGELSEGQEVAVEKHTLPFVTRANEVAASIFVVELYNLMRRSGLSKEEAEKFLAENGVFTNHTIKGHALPKHEGYIYRGTVRKGLAPEVAEEVDAIMQMPGQDRYDIGAFVLRKYRNLNGVSADHATVASRLFSETYGFPIEFHGATNGINLNRWARNFADLYRKAGIYTEHDHVAQDYAARVDTLNPFEIYQRKIESRREMFKYLREERVDQYGMPVEIPEDRKIAVWARRIDAYKQPDLPFGDIPALKKVLKEENIHLILSGNAHPENEGMKILLDQVLIAIDDDPELRERVTYVQNYNEALSKKLVAGADMWINTPTLGEEACGTSIFKAIANMTKDVSTPDGGMLDNRNGRYRKIEGKTKDEQRVSLLEQLRIEAQLIQRRKESPDGIIEWAESVKAQFKDYAPVLSAGRMLEDYVNWMRPKPSTLAA